MTTREKIAMRFNYNMSIPALTIEILFIETREVLENNIISVLVRVYSVQYSSRTHPREMSSRSFAFR